MPRLWGERDGGNALKILGKVNDGFIVEITRTEAYNLIGYYSGSSSRTGKIPLDIGDEIVIHEMYQQLYKLSQERKHLTDVQKTLRAAANNIDEVIPVLDISGGPDGKEYEDEDK